MDTTTLIAINEFCDNHGITHAYIYELHQFGLFTIEKEDYLLEHELPKVEKIIRFHRDLEINLEGIDVILNLLERVEKQERDLQDLRNRLTIYE